MNLSLKNKLLLKFYNIVLTSKQLHNKVLLNHHLKTENVQIGRYTYGSPKIVWDKYSDFKIIIGQFCSIADNVIIHNGSNHNINWISTYPHRIMFDMKGKYTDGHPCSKGDIKIGNDVWIGENTTIYSGVTIGDGVVIAGNSVVVKNIEPYSVYGGAPATFIKKRFTDKEIQQLLKMKWWDWDINKIKEAIPFLCDENLTVFFEKYG